MNSFIIDTVQKLKEKDISKSHFVLPSRRSAQAFSKELYKNKRESFLAPKIQSIEEFIESVADTNIISNLDTLFEFYKVYQEHTHPNKQEPLEQVYNWGQSIIQDFNEIDRYNIDAEQFFGNLKAIKDLEHWSKSEVKTDLVQNYIEFWNSLPRYYFALKQELKLKHKSYQGMAYLEAKANLPKYLEAHQKQIYFIGFNALNSCEEDMFKHVVQKNRGNIFWDIDQTLLSENTAGLFLRNYAKNWQIYKDKALSPSCNTFTDSKKINFYGVAKKIGQAKLVGQILSDLDEEELEQTALILGDETLLQPILNSLPKNVKNVNVTMGLPLASTSLTSLFEVMFKIRMLNEEVVYYESLISILAQPNMKEQFQRESIMIQKNLTVNNIIFQNKKEFFEKWDHLDAKFLKVIRTIIDTKDISVDEIIDKCLSVIEQLKPDDNQDNITLEYFFGFKKLFTKLKNLLNKSELIQDFKIFNQIYLDILSKETLDFEGSPYNGLQIMGMLESRVLDFKNVIITSVNEGILPAGKSQNSFIPFDLKKAYKLPTFKEKDAVYAYHFFRLIQRANHCHFIYNNSTSGIEKAEKSRFLVQLETFKAPKHTLQNITVSAKSDSKEKSLEAISKTPEMISKVKSLLHHGISPSALTTYIRNPIDFYQRYVLGLKDIEEMEQDITYSALGTIIHDCLDLLYKEFLDKELKPENIDKMLKACPQVIDELLEQKYQKDVLTFGKNLIDSEIAKQQVKRFLIQEKQTLKNNSIKIIELETTNVKLLDIQGLNFKIKLKGTVDRVDLYNSKLRITDYKTGKVEDKQLKIPEGWNDFIEDYTYSKAFQILFYALLKENQLDENSQAGIISFKNLKAEFMRCKSTTKPEDNLKELVKKFKLELEALILDILNPDIPFTEKSV